MKRKARQDERLRCSGGARKMARQVGLWLGLAGLLPCGMAEASSVQVYQGMLGARGEVVLELSTPAAGEPRQGRYFYRRHGVDIPLRGTPGSLAEGLPLDEIDDAGDAREAVFEDPATRKPRFVWKGRIQGARYRGEWRDLRSGKSRPFELRLVATYDPDAARPTGVEAVTQAIVQGVGSPVASDVAISMARTPYEYLRVAVPLTEGPEMVLGSVAYRMLRDPRTRVAYPRLTRHPDPGMLRQANRLLEQRHWEMNLGALACASSRYTARGPEAGTLGGYPEEAITVEYLSPTLMSVVESGSIGCGGAHPHNHFDPYTLDLLRGGYFDFARILEGYGTGETEHGPAFLAFLDEALQRQPEPDDCEGILPMYLQLHFIRPDRLAFDVSGVGHAMGACLGTKLTLPFSTLGPILKPEAASYLAPARTSPKGMSR